MTGATAAAGKVLVIGIGNPDRGDDGIGPLVAQRIAECRLSGVTTLIRSGDALALIEDWTGHDAVVLIDAAAMPKSRCPTPGRVHRIDLLTEPFPPELSLASTHMFGVVEAVGLARALGMLPGRMIAFAIEGTEFGPGARLSPEVAAAAGETAARIVAEVRGIPNRD